MKMRIEIADIILWILFILSIAISLWYLFGDSPTLEQIILAFLFTSIFSIVINVSKDSVKINYIEKEMKDLKQGIKDSFNKIKDDINIVKEDLNYIKSKIK